MTEEKTVSKPKQLWNNALRAVKGDNTNQLVEDFTSEMTLVAEGLCEDQARLRKAVEDLTLESDRGIQRTRSEVQALETTIQETQRDLDRRMDELSRRMDAFESREKALAARKPEKRVLNGLLPQITLIVGILCGSWVLVTILNLFK